MKIGLVVDATCDLPAPYIKEHHIQVLPITLRIGDEHVVDDRNPDTRQAFYADNRLDKGHDAESVPLDVDAFRAPSGARIFFAHFAVPLASFPLIFAEI